MNIDKNTLSHYSNKLQTDNEFRNWIAINEIFVIFF